MQTTTCALLFSTLPSCEYIHRVIQTTPLCSGGGEEGPGPLLFPGLAGPRCAPLRHGTPGLHQECPQVLLPLRPHPPTGPLQCRGGQDRDVHCAGHHVAGVGGWDQRLPVHTQPQETALHDGTD